MSYGRAKCWQTKPKPGCFIDPTHPLSRGLVGCWLFNEGAGSRLTDYSGYGNHGVLMNMNPARDWVGSLHGGALNFNSSYISLYGSNQLDISDGDFTITGRILIRSGFDNWIASKGGASAPSYLFGYHSSGVFRFLIQDSSEIIIINSTSITVSRFYHIAVVAKRKSNAIIYIDSSVLANLSISSAQGSLSNSDIFEIGRDRSQSGISNGFVDNIYIYNRDLAKDEIIWLDEIPYDNFIQPTWRKYFVPMTIGGNASRFAHQYRQRRNFV